MWVARFKVTHEGSLTSPFAEKHNFSMLVFPLNTYVEKGKIYLTTGHYVLGDEKSKKAYFEEAIKNPRVLDYDISGDLLIYTFWAPLKNTHLQQWITPNILFLKPPLIDQKGIQHYVIGSWKKENLTKVLNKIKPNTITFELESLKQEKVSDLFIPHLAPPLSKKQKEIFNLAYSMGYYKYPKKTNIEKMAKKAKLSPSTFQEHLRRAESKVIPFTMENIFYDPDMQRAKQD
ncbi:helix-turn-helix domain-containing protein [Candidatus Micrarchaeota archaeon]|nr:helix-turn-helix domain-containing protein [Candidatus Micrarchaeota archaeon]